MALAESLEKDFRAAMDDDLDVPNAIAVIQTFVREANAILDREAPAPASLEAARGAFTRVGEVLQIVPARQENADEQSTQARALAEERRKAKLARNYARADELKSQIRALGFDVRDSKDGGYELRRLAEQNA